MEEVIWQYATLWFVDDETAFWHAGETEERVATPEAEGLCALLNRAGSHGWELVAMASFETNSVRYVFKRPVKSSSLEPAASREAQTSSWPAA
jgi:hypothetical protein